MNLLSKKKKEILSIGIFISSNPQGGGGFQYSQSFVESVFSVKDNFPANVYVFYDKEIKKIKDWIYEQFSEEDRIFFKFFYHPRSFSREFLKMISFILKRPLFPRYLYPDTKFMKKMDLFFVPFITPNIPFFINKPFIFTLHDLQEKYYPEFFTFKEKILRNIANSTLSKKALHILCESKNVKSDIIKFLNIPSKKISVIPAPPPKLFFNEIKLLSEKFKEVKKKYNLPENYIFYPAQFWYHKNHLNLLEAFKVVTKKFPETFLVFTGSKQNNYYNVLKKIKDLNLEKKVFILGYVDYKDLPYIYKMSKFVVIPSLFESISIPIYEAFSLKVPVCASNICGIPEQVGEAAILFNPKSVEDIADKMIIMLKNKNLREKIAKLGNNRLKLLNHENFGFKILNLTLKIRKKYGIKNLKDT